MATTEIKVLDLRINKLTKAQFETITPSETELYFVTDDSSDTTYTDFTGADGTTAGTSGLVPAPQATDNNKFLKGDGTWGTIASASVDQTYNASSSNAQSGIAVAEALAPINTLIPSAASASNQLADKSFVNSSISSNTSNFIGTFSSLADLEAYSGTVTNNDYAYVTTVDTAGNTVYNRYKYSSNTWVFEYALNNSSFTAAEWDAIKSEITKDTKVVHTASVAVGNTTTPVYVTSNGTVTTLSYTLEKSVPSNAVFTDTTYTTFTGANGTSAGTSGLVPKPQATDNVKVLSGAGTWISVPSTSGSNTFSGATSFTNSVSLGSLAIATTTTIIDNDTSVATTAFARALQTHQPINTVTYASNQAITLTSGYSLYKLTPTGNISSMTFTLSGTSASSTVSYTFELYLILNSTYSIAWPSNLTWMDGTELDLSTTGTYFFAFRSVDGGSSWLGNLQGKW